MNDDDQSYQHPEQSVRLAGCPLCQVLYPEREGQCEDCGGRVTEVEAQMMSRELIEERVEMIVQAFLQTPGNTSQRRRALDGLLGTLHTYRPSAATFLAGASVSLDQLRREHETLPKG